MKKLSSIILMALFACSCSNKLPENSNKVESQLFLGEGENLPLVVGLGGSEGGNAWASDRCKQTRQRFIDEGYAFLAIGYFGAEGTPKSLDRIAIDAVHQAIIEAAKNPKINARKIAIIGGSKGAELALLLGSRYSDIKCVVAMVAGKCAFPALTFGASTSSWTYKGDEVPYVPMPWSALPAAIKGDLRSAFSTMLEDSMAVERALIKVENINGPILFLSAKEDEMWPSSEMSNDMMIRLKLKGFTHHYQHIAVEGGHNEVLDHFDAVFTFLANYFKSTDFSDSNGK